MHVLIEISFLVSHCVLYFCKVSFRDLVTILQYLTISWDWDRLRISRIVNFKLSSTTYLQHETHFAVFKTELRLSKMSGTHDDYMWCYVVPQTESTIERFVELSSSDRYYYENPHRRQFIALKFLHLIDPTLLCQSLFRLADLYPKINSRICVFEGRPHFNLQKDAIKVRLISIEPQVLLDVYEIRRACFHLSDQLDKQGNKSMLYVFLLRSSDPHLGCILAAGFDHSLGDAASYSMFLHALSEDYANVLSASSARTDPDEGQQQQQLPADFMPFPAAPGNQAYAFNLRQKILSSKSG